MLAKNLRTGDPISKRFQIGMSQSAVSQSACKFTVLLYLAGLNLYPILECRIGNRIG